MAHYGIDANSIWCSATQKAPVKYSAHVCKKKNSNKECMHDE